MTWAESLGHFPSVQGGWGQGISGTRTVAAGNHDALRAGCQQTSALPITPQPSDLLDATEDPALPSPLHKESHLATSQPGQVHCLQDASGPGGRGQLSGKPHRTSRIAPA